MAEGRRRGPRRACRPVPRLLPLLLLTACTIPAADSRAPDKTPADCPDYATVGAPTLTTWCAPCHSAALAGDARHGAPEGVDLDTLAGARTWADRVRARALEAQDMPYGGGIPAAERARLETWLACGLPGEELAWPDARPADRPDRASDRAAEVVEDGADLLLVLAWDGVDREVLRFRKTGATASWVEEAYFDADGAPTWSRAWDPPLRVWEDADAWSDTVTATREEDGETTTATETWAFERGPAEEIDARLRDPDATQLVATSSAGETYTWWLSTVTSFAERRRVTATEEDVSLGLTVPGGATIEGFPVEAGGNWAERGYTRFRDAE